MTSATDSKVRIESLDINWQKFLAAAKNGSRCIPDKADGTGDSDDYQ
jgi:hypothetical protein